MNEKIKTQMNAQRRAALFRIEFSAINVGDTLRCTGLDVDSHCSNLDTRETVDCGGCGAVDLVDGASIVGPGLLLKER